MARLVILTSAELTRDPRARRAAAAAFETGWDVVGVCAATGGSPAELPGVRVIRVGSGRIDMALRSVGLGGGRRDGPLLRELRGLYRVGGVGVVTLALWFAGRRLGRADVVHANDFETLPAGRLLARTLSARLVYDAHELYTLQEAAPPRLHRDMVRRLERMLARRADTVVTVSEPIARELEQLLGLSRTPLVVLNCPATTSRAAATTVGRPLQAVYQGALGHGRSLDDLLDAATDTVGVAFNLRIVGIDAGALCAEVARRGLANCVTVLEPVDPGALVDGLTDFDVGIVITRPLTRNDELAAPNKLFEYLMAGLAIVAPRLPGIVAIVEDTHLGVTFEPGSPTSLAEALSALAASPDKVAAIKKRARAAALTEFNAESQRPVLAAAWGA